MYPTKSNTSKVGSMSEDNKDVTKTHKLGDKQMSTYKNHIFWIHDLHKDDTFQIVGKSKFMLWLNNHADCDRYLFFSTYTKLKNYLED